ncbi:carbohydrate porin [Marivita sp. S0852]|uniref:carbohydrate porin n=1 Tax=Marivita sp. S0852 TaxID=3373893 RepID=UPI003981AAC1
MTTTPYRSARRRRSALLAGCASALLLTHPDALMAQSSATDLAGPDAAGRLIASDTPSFAEDWQKSKALLAERTGLELAFDYNALGFAASASLGEDSAAGGVFRMIGKWSLLNRGGPDTGSLVFKLEHRHAYRDVAITDFGNELGYIGLVNSVYNDQGWRATNLYWQQNFAGGRATASLGWLDVTDYVDVYALASPWTGFSNLAFQTGSGTIAGLPDGALGLSAAGFVTDTIYVAAGIVDANADPTDIGAGIDSLFDEGETFKSVEMGWTSGPKAVFIDNAHLTFWQIDAREEAGSPESHGVAFSLTTAINDQWMPFLRGGWADGGGSLYEASVSAGFGYTKNPGQQLTGVGLNWSRPNSETFGDGLDEQVTAEVFSRWQPLDGVEITPSLQFIKNPALNPDENVLGIFGLRLRVVF